MDDSARILESLRQQVGALASETAVSVLAEVQAFGPVRDEQLAAELFTLAEQGIGLLVEVMIRDTPPSDLAYIGRFRPVARQLQVAGPLLR